jgi:hypothetical protein
MFPRIGYFQTSEFDSMTRLAYSFAGKKPFLVKMFELMGHHPEGRTP